MYDIFLELNALSGAFLTVSLKRMSLAESHTDEDMSRKGISVTNILPFLVPISNIHCNLCLDFELNQTVVHCQNIF